MTNWKQGELPPVGKECEYLWHEGAEWRKGYCVAHYVNKESTEAVLCDMEDNIAVRVYAHEVKPIKTPAEIERERLINQMFNDAEVIGSKGAFEKLVDKGYRKVDPEKRVKPVSLSIFSKAWVNANSVEEHYESLKYLGYIQGVDNDDS